MIENRSSIKNNYVTEYIINNWEKIVKCVVCGKPMRLTHMEGLAYNFGYLCICGYCKSIPILVTYSPIQNETIDEKEARIWRKQTEKISSNIPNIWGGKPAHTSAKWD